VQRHPEEVRFLAAAVIASLLAIGLISIVPTPNTASRLAPWAGVLGGLAYGPIYWGWRFKKIRDQGAILAFCGLFALPSFALALARVPYSATVYSAGFIITMTGGMWLGSIVSRLAASRTSEAPEARPNA
jgi:hypothetical protein